MGFRAAEVMPHFVLMPRLINGPLQLLLLTHSAGQSGNLLYVLGAVSEKQYK